MNSQNHPRLLKKGHENQENLLYAGQRLVLLQRDGDGLCARRTDVIGNEAEKESWVNS